jgi:hypothetical protein
MTSYSLWRARNWFQLGVLVAAGAGAFGCVSAQVDFEEVEVTKQNLQFPGADQVAVQLGVPADGVGAEPTYVANPEAAAANAASPSAATRSAVASGADATTSVAPELLAGTSVEAYAELLQSVAESIGRLDKDGNYALPPQPFSYSGGAGKIPSDINTSLTLHEIIIQSHAEQPNLAFIQRLLLTSRNPSVDHGNPQVVFDYRRATDRQPQANTIRIAIADKALDRSVLANSTYELAVWGNLKQLPRKAWAVDVSFRLSGSMSVDY